MRFLYTSTCVIAVMGCVMSTAAHAGMTSGNDGASETNSPTGAQEQEPVDSGIADIIVTAQRRSENLQRAAIPVSAVTGDALLAAGAFRPTELTALVPALQIGANSGPFNSIYLRGVGNPSSNPLTEGAVAFNFEGVYVGRPASTTGSFFDLERVEVVKGPQGTLYGRNATGGAINVIAHKPDLGKFGASVALEFGNYDALRVDATINIPLGDNAAFRVAGMRAKHDGYMSDGLDDQDDWAVRASFAAEPTDTFRFALMADYFAQNADGVGSTPRIGVRGVATPATFDTSARIGFLSPEGQAFYASQPNTLFGRNFYPVPANVKPFMDNHFWGLQGNFEWDTALGTFTIIPAHRESHLDFISFTPGLFTLQKESSAQNSFEARLATPDDKPLRGILGTYYYGEDVSVPLLNANHQTNSSYFYFKSKTDSKALFGRLTYAFTPEIRLNVGARQTWESKSLDGDFLSISRVCPPRPFALCPAATPIPYSEVPPAATIPNAANGPAPYAGLIQVSPLFIQNASWTFNHNTQDFNKFTWRVGADWDLTPRNLLYVSFETGFKAGGFYFAKDNPATANVEGIFKPETIKALTFGSKNRFFNNTFQINLEGFYWRYTDQQVAHLGLDYTGTATFVTENVGRSTLKGFEVETRWQPTQWTTLSADLQYLDAQYDTFVYTTPNQNGGTFNGTACPNASTPAVVYTIDCSGRRPPQSPKWTLNLGGQQRVPVGSGELVFDTHAHFQTRTLTGLEFLPIEYQPSYWLVDAAITYRGPDSRFSIGAFVNNMFDETVIHTTFPTSFSSFFSSSLRPPRTYGVRAGVKF